MRVILVSHTNLHGNSAMHVFALAEELRAIGHDPIMLIPDSLDTIDTHRRPSFPIKLYADALAGDLPFRSGGRAELIHSWTPREHVRRLTLSLAALQGCRYIVHMEDNEQQIVTDDLKEFDFNEMSTLQKQYSDITISEYRTHPHSYYDFLDGAAGYTCLIDRLLEFKPKHVEGIVIWPGFDPEFEAPPGNTRSTRARLGIADDEYIIFYGGNSHNSIVKDLRNLYLAIDYLRRTGQNVRLLRTGWNHTPLDLARDVNVAKLSIELGFVDRAEMPFLLGCSDILAQPGKSDVFNDYRFPSKLPEYLVSGKPVILPRSNIGLALTDGYDALLLERGTLHELIAKITTLIGDGGLRRRIGMEGRRFALAKLRWSTAARKVDTLYRAAVRAEITGAANPPDGTGVMGGRHPVKIIAFYLPQFHPIDENNLWWGKGFTEWTNVSRALPQIYAHRQPRLPTELGYYDLRLIDIFFEQVRLAETYGVGGFCFYYYSFDGRRLLEKPLDAWLARGPTFPFCICWANENWSRRWDGSDSEVLVAQSYADGFAEKFIFEVLPILQDPRYIRVGGAPLLTVYKVADFPDAIAVANEFRRVAAENGLPRIHLAMVQSFGVMDPRIYGFDSAIEFSPPHVNRLLLHPNNSSGVNANFSGYIEDYIGVAAQSINAEPTDYIRYRGCFPMWDNTARRGTRGHIFVNESPKAYAYWLRFLVNEALVRRRQVEPLVFINAWNEWAEGAYLEPDEHHGRSLLEVTRLALHYGFADFVLEPSPERERTFSAAVSVVPKLR